MQRDNIDKIAKNNDDRLLLAKLWDKIQAGIRRNIPASTCFLSPYEQEMARYLFGDYPGLHFWGGYDGAERRLLLWLPDYLSEDALWEEDGPIVCLHCDFFEGDAPSHRDFLGALMGMGIARETVGDICVDKGRCDFFVTAEIAPFLLQNFTGAGRTRVQISRIPLAQANIPQPAVKELRDTVSSLRLDSVLSAGFRISRSAAAQYISAGKAAIDGLPCEKADKTVAEGVKLSLRGFGKISLVAVGSQTKKGRIPVVIHRYV